MVGYNGGTLTASFVYDGDGVRVKGIVNGVTTVYIGEHYEVSGTTVKKYYYSGGARVAERVEGSTIPSENGLFFLLTDHLGSTTRILKSGSGSLYSEQRYNAWGTTRYTYGSLPTSFQYTGQRNEPSLGIYYYKARWYDPVLGRFLQPDSIVPLASQGVTAHDRYAAMNNNPVRYNDPTGHAVPVEDRYKKRSVITKQEPAPSSSFVATSSYRASSRAPTLHERISGGVRIGQNSGPVQLNYNSDYPGDAANSGNVYFNVNNYNPKAPCVDMFTCGIVVIDTGLRVAAPFLSPTEKSSENNVGWNFIVTHARGEMSPGNIELWTTFDDAFIHSIELQNGDRSDIVNVGAKIPAGFGAGYVVENIPTGYTGVYPLQITINIQCVACANFGQGPTSYGWSGQETINYKQIH